jgi:hypothetical protein
MTTVSTAASPLPKEPYRGLEPYRYCDRSIFFEREDDAELLFRQVAMYRGSLLYGESGVGKSSLLNAGFFPKALEAGFLVERIRVQPVAGREFVLERIARSAAAGDWLPSTLADSVAEGQTTFAAAQFQTLVTSLAESTGIVLLFDQFEELLTHAPEQVSGKVTLDARDRIINTIVSLMHDRSASRLRMLLVFREDYLAKFDSLFYLCPELPDRFIRLQAPLAAALPRLLRGPFESKTIPAGHWPRVLPEAVTAALQKQLAPQESGGRIALPQVQIAALQLWRSETPAESLQERGIDGLVADFLAEQLIAFGAHRPAAEVALAEMITREGTRKIVPESEALDAIHQEEKLTEAGARTVLDRLVNPARLARRDYNRGGTTYEIVSEFLVPWIRRLKLQRTAQRAKKAAIKRVSLIGAAIMIAAAVPAGTLFYSRYSALSKEQLVQEAQARTREATNAEAKARESARQAEERATTEAAARGASELKQKRLDAEVKRLNEALRREGDEFVGRLLDDVRKAEAAQAAAEQQARAAQADLDQHRRDDAIAIARLKQQVGTAESAVIDQRNLRLAAEAQVRDLTEKLDTATRRATPQTVPSGAVQCTPPTKEEGRPAFRSGILAYRNATTDEQWRAVCGYMRAARTETAPPTLVEISGNDRARWAPRSVEAIALLQLYGCAAAGPALMAATAEKPDPDVASRVAAAGLACRPR